jgi:septal ring factor EnvC (AmiA/AmiB activator)
LPAVDTAVAGTPQGDPVPAVAIDVEDHAEAKDRFAGLMASLHRFESEAIDELKADLKAIATLLQLHTVASGKAESTGDYSSDDL